MYPAVTATVPMPWSRQAWAVSMAYSANTMESLYVNATDDAPHPFAAYTMSSG